MNAYLIALIQGIVEGLTEFLPVSSTGHLILTGSLLRFTGEVAKTFEIVIQLGAILAVVVVYRRKFGRMLADWRSAGSAGHGLTLAHIGLAMIPALIVGLLLHDAIKEHLFSSWTVLIGLVAGGLFMLLSQWRHGALVSRSVDQVSYRQSFGIGLFQCLALWPGFSRAGATIAGGLLLGADYRASAEFSFLLAVPMMAAATGLDLIKSMHNLHPADLGPFLVGFVVSFLVALLVVVTFLRLLERWKLAPFAVYRFVIAALFGVYLLRDLLG
jgi:undecaprenyl-diphosphatase